MNFRKIYEDYNVKYAKGNNGPFDEWDTAIKNPKTIKPAVKGTPHFSVEQAKQPASNKPSCPHGEDSYNARYSKTGLLTESELEELEDSDIEIEDDDTDEFAEIITPDEIENYEDLENEFPDEEDLEDEEMREFADWKFEQETPTIDEEFPDDFELDEEDLEDEEMREFGYWKQGLDLEDVD
jgi:hypothetical protein